MSSTEIREAVARAREAREPTPEQTALIHLADLVLGHFKVHDSKIPGRWFRSWDENMLRRAVCPGCDPSFTCFGGQYDGPRADCRKVPT